MYSIEADTPTVPEKIFNYDSAHIRDLHLSVRDVGGDVGTVAGLVILIRPLGLPPD